MSGIHKFSRQVIDLAERLEDVTDAAQGRGRRAGGGGRWLLLPAVGAGLYALGTSNAFGRRAKDVVDHAKARAAELPDELLNSVRESSQATSSGTTSRRSNGSQRKSSSSGSSGKSRPRTQSKSRS